MIWQNCTRLQVFLKLTISDPRAYPSGQVTQGDYGVLVGSGAGPSYGKTKNSWTFKERFQGYFKNGST